jgi:hypothetical protein
VSDILYSGSSETFEFEWIDLDLNFSNQITNVNIQYIRYLGNAAEYLQSNGTTFSSAVNSFAAVSQDTNKYIWNHTLTIPASMVGFNVFVRAIPIISTGDLPAIEDDFFVFNAVDDLTIAQYSRDNVETNRNFTSGIGYVS